MVVEVLDKDERYVASKGSVLLKRKSKNYVEWNKKEKYLKCEKKDNLYKRLV